MPSPTLLTLPAEIRNQILELVFPPLHLHRHSGFITSSENDENQDPGLLLDATYSAPSHLLPLLVCRQLYSDAHLLALNRTTFTLPNLFADIPARLAAAALRPSQISALRSIAFVADARHFRKLLEWGDRPLGMRGLRLETLTIVLHRSSFWHYLFDFTADLVSLLRGLEGVRRLVFVRNAASVKGSFKAWFHRLVGLMMKVDHRERYEVVPANLERTWWRWRYDDEMQSFELEARPVKEMVAEEDYMRLMRPLVEELRVGIEGEEWNPDPRAWNGT